MHWTVACLLLSAVAVSATQPLSRHQRQKGAAEAPLYPVDEPAGLLRLYSPEHAHHEGEDEAALAALEEEGQGFEHRFSQVTATRFGSCVDHHWGSCLSGSGRCSCPQYGTGMGGYMTGIYRAGSACYTYSLNHVACCTIDDLPVETSADYSMPNMDYNYRWGVCPSGMYVMGIVKTSCNWLYCIDKLRCGRPPAALYSGYETCTDVKNPYYWSRCPTGYYVAGFYRGSCYHLHCLTHMRCCKPKKK